MQPLPTPFLQAQQAPLPSPETTPVSIDNRGDLYPSLTSYQFNRKTEVALRKSGNNPTMLARQFEKAHASGDFETKAKLANKFAFIDDQVNGGNAAQNYLASQRVASTPAETAPVQYGKTGLAQSVFGTIANGLWEIPEAVGKLGVAGAGFTGILDKQEWERANKGIDDVFGGLKTYVSDEWQRSPVSYDDKNGLQFDLNFESIVGTLSNLTSYVLPGFLTAGGASLATLGARGAAKAAVTGLAQAEALGTLAKAGSIATKVTGITSFLQMFPAYQKEALSSGLNVRDATLWAIPVAAVNGAIETANMGALTKAFGIGEKAAKNAIRHVGLQEATDALIGLTGKELTPELLTEAGKRAAKNTLGLIAEPEKLGAFSRFFSGTGKRIGRGFVEQGIPEGAEEFFQSLVENSSKDVYNNIKDSDSTGRFADPSFGKYAFDALYGATLGALVGAGMGTVVQGKQLDPTVYGFVGSNVRDGLRKGIALEDMLSGDPQNPARLKMLGLLDHKLQEKELTPDEHADLSQKVVRMAQTAQTFAGVNTFSDADQHTMFAISEARQKLDEAAKTVAGLRQQYEQAAGLASDPGLSEPDRLKAQYEQGQFAQQLGGAVQTENGPLYQAEWQQQQRKAAVETVVGQAMQLYASDTARPAINTFVKDNLAQSQQQAGIEAYADDFKPARLVVNPASGVTLVADKGQGRLRKLSRTGGAITRPAMLDENGTYVAAERSPVADTYSQPVESLDEYMSVSQALADRSNPLQADDYRKPDNSPEANWLQDGRDLLEQIGQLAQTRKKKVLADTQSMAAAWLNGSGFLRDNDKYAEPYAQVARDLQAATAPVTSEATAPVIGGEVDLMNLEPNAAVADANTMPAEGLSDSTTNVAPNEPTTPNPRPVSVEQNLVGTPTRPSAGGTDFLDGLQLAADQEQRSAAGENLSNLAEDLARLAIAAGPTDAGAKSLLDGLKRANQALADQFGQEAEETESEQTNRSVAEAAPIQSAQTAVADADTPKKRTPAKAEPAIIDRQPQDLREAILGYFATGGRMRRSDLAHYGDPNLLKGAKGGNPYLSYIAGDEKAPALDTLARQVVEERLGRAVEDFDEQAVMQEIIDTVASFAGHGSPKTQLRAHQQGEFARHNEQMDAEVEAATAKTSLEVLGPFMDAMDRATVPVGIQDQLVNLVAQQYVTPDGMDWVGVLHLLRANGLFEKYADLRNSLLPMLDEVAQQVPTTNAELWAESQKILDEQRSSDLSNAWWSEMGEQQALTDEQYNQLISDFYGEPTEPRASESAGQSGPDTSGRTGSGEAIRTTKENAGLSGPGNIASGESGADAAENRLGQTVTAPAVIPTDEVTDDIYRAFRADPANYPLPESLKQAIGYRVATDTASTRDMVIYQNRTNELNPYKSQLIGQSQPVLFQLDDNTATPSTGVQALLDRLNQNLQVPVVTDPAEINRVLAESGASEAIQDRVAKGFYYNGTVYLNPELADESTVLEELTHIWNAVVRQDNPALWKTGVTLAKSSRYWNEVMADSYYKTRPLAEQEDEAVAKMVADQGRKFVLPVKQKGVRDWLQTFWNFIKEKLGFGTDADLSKLTIGDFSRLAVEQIKSGEVGGSPSENADVRFQLNPETLADERTQARPIGQVLTTDMLRQQAIEALTNSPDTVQDNLLKQKSFTKADRAYIEQVARTTGFKLEKGKLEWTRPAGFFHGTNGALIRTDLADVAALMEDNFGRGYNAEGNKGWVFRQMFAKLKANINLESFIRLLDDSQGTLRALILDPQREDGLQADYIKNTLKGYGERAEELLAPFSTMLGNSTQTAKSLTVRSYDFDRDGNVVVVERQLPVAVGMGLALSTMTQFVSHGKASGVIDTAPLPDDLYTREANGRLTRKVYGEIYENPDSKEVYQLLLLRADANELIKRFRDGMGAYSGETEAFAALRDYFNEGSVADVLEEKANQLNPGNAFQRVQTQAGNDSYYPIRTAKSASDARAESREKRRTLDENSRLLARTGVATATVLADPVALMRSFANSASDVVAYGRTIDNLVQLVNSLDKYQGPQKDEIRAYLQRRIEQVQNFRTDVARQRESGGGAVAVLDKIMRTYGRSVLNNLVSPLKQTITLGSAMASKVIDPTYIKHAQVLSLLGKLTVGSYRDITARGDIDITGQTARGLSGVLDTDTLERPYIEKLLGNEITDPDEKKKHLQRWATVINRTVGSVGQFVDGAQFEDFGLNQNTLTNVQKRIQQLDNLADRYFTTGNQRTDRAVVFAWQKAAELSGRDQGLTGEALDDYMAKTVTDLLHENYSLSNLFSRTPLSLSNNFLFKMLGLYAAQSQVQGNLLMRAVADWSKAEPGSEEANAALHHLYSTAGWAILFNAISVSVIGALGRALMAVLSGDPVDEPEKIGQQIVWDSLKNTIGVYPGLGQAATEYLIATNDTINSGGNDALVDFPAAELIQQGLDSVSNVGTVLLSGDEKKADKALDALVRDLPDMAAKGLGIPGNIRKVVTENLLVDNDN